MAGCSNNGNEGCGRAFEAPPNYPGGTGAAGVLLFHLTRGQGACPVCVSPVSNEGPRQQGPREMLAKQTTAENISKGRSLGTLSVSENKTYRSCSSPSAQGADYSLGMINPQQFPAERGKAGSVSTRRRGCLGNQKPWETKFLNFPFVSA